MEAILIWLSGFLTGAMISRAFVMVYEYEWETKGYLTLGQAFLEVVGKVSDKG